jgi:mannose-6-phosphate isomerase-like protein (cupin superfamily)
MHIHDYDQFYLVLDGSLHVQYALTRYVVQPRELAVIPAGVPHRQWNEGPGIERHLVIHAPTPEQPHLPDNPWFTLVDLDAADPRQQPVDEKE